MTRLLLIALVALFACRPATAEEAIVQRIIDGDTIYACGNDCYTVRISNIDAPEMPPKAKCQQEADLALEARQRLTTAIHGQTVELVVGKRKRDRYGRLLARVFIGGEDVGDQLIAAGVARPWTGRREPWC